MGYSEVEAGDLIPGFLPDVLVYDRPPQAATPTADVSPTMLSIHWSRW
jgi:hypothetical protein